MKGIDAITLYVQTVNGDNLYTYYCEGGIVELPTKWLKSLFLESRYSPKTIEQYASNFKGFLKWLFENGKYGKVSLDKILKVCSRRELQQWILHLRKTVSATTIRNKEATIKNFFEWTTTEIGGRTRNEQDFPYKTGKYISVSPNCSKPRYIAIEELVRESSKVNKKAISNWIDYFVKINDLRGRNGNPLVFTLSRFRPTKFTELVEKGYDLFHIMAIAGHASIKTTLAYIDKLKTITDFQYTIKKTLTDIKNYQQQNGQLFDRVHELETQIRELLNLNTVLDEENKDLIERNNELNSELKQYRQQSTPSSNVISIVR